MTELEDGGHRGVEGGIGGRAAGGEEKRVDGGGLWTTSREVGAGPGRRWLPDAEERMIERD